MKIGIWTRLCLAGVMTLWSGAAFATGAIADASDEAAMQASEPATQGVEAAVEELMFDSPDVEAPEAFDYFTVAGTTLRPRSSASTWTYGANGCVYRSAGSDLFNTELHVPNGVTLNYLRLYFYDTSASNQTAWITRYRPSTPSTEDLVSVLSSGNAGQGTALSSLINHVVDNVNYAYVLNWSPGANGSGMKLCGLRVAYTP
jgi:hypothetical protein